MIDIIRRDHSSCTIWGRRVELRILGECLLAFLPVTVYVFPDLRSAVDEGVWTNTDYISILVVEYFDPGVLLAPYLVEYLRNRRDSRKFRSWIMT